MQTIELDGSGWSGPGDFFEALRSALGACDGHGTGPDAFEDSMVYQTDMLRVQPPYEIVIRRPHPSARAAVEAMGQGLREQRRWRREHWGSDTEVSLSIV